MVYNWRQIKMKKYIFIFMLLSSFSAITFAQDASAGCKLPGTYDYVNVDFYKGYSNDYGSFTISNQSSDYFVTEISVRITCEIMTCWEGEDNYGRPETKCSRWKEVTLYSNKVRKLGQNDDATISVKMPEYENIRNIKVSVWNLNCKPIE